MEVREELRYSKEHEWVTMEDGVMTLGITDYAQDSLGDIVYVELPEVGMIIQADEALGNIESVKAVSELFCPIAGKVIEINKELEDQPELVNSEPYEGGWIAKLKVSPDEFEAAKLMDAEEYTEFTQS